MNQEESSTATSLTVFPVASKFNTNGFSRILACNFVVVMVMLSLNYAIYVEYVANSTISVTPIAYFATIFVISLLSAFFSGWVSKKIIAYYRMRCIGKTLAATLFILVLCSMTYTRSDFTTIYIFLSTYFYYILYCRILSAMPLVLYSENNNPLKLRRLSKQISFKQYDLRAAFDRNNVTFEKLMNILTIHSTSKWDIELYSICDEKDFIIGKIVVRYPSTKTLSTILGFFVYDLRYRYIIVIMNSNQFKAFILKFDCVENR